MALDTLPDLTSIWQVGLGLSPLPKKLDEILFEKAEHTVIRERVNMDKRIES